LQYQAVSRGSWATGFVIQIAPGTCEAGFVPHGAARAVDVDVDTT
jgi:hypothetical protein